MDDAETIPYASPKSENKIDEKVYKEPKLETPAEIEIQNLVGKIF